MRLLGFEITRQKAALPTGLSSVDSSRGWWPMIREPFTGAWQRNLEVRVETAVSNPVLFRCISLISGDIAKMRCRLVTQDEHGIWSESDNPAFSPVLRKPNRYQNRIQFFQTWMQSKLTFGNAYVLKARDNRQVVTALYVLDPNQVRPMVGADGSIWYQLNGDNLSGLQEATVVPASEIIHDRWNTLFHPLCGLSPIYACGLAAIQGSAIQKNSTSFFQNGAQPGGILTHPDFIDEDVAKEYADRWKAKYGGDNQGSIAVLGNGLEYKPIAVNSVDSQLIEQLKWTGEAICGAFGVPAYMAGVGTAPLNNNVQTLAELYYSQCVQIHIESVELCLDDGLGVGIGTKKDGVTYGVEFDLDDLLRMDSASQMEALDKGKNILTPNEARLKLNLPPKTGGDAVLRQQQDYSIEALAKRDALDDPFGKAAPASPVADESANDNAELDEARAAAKAAQASVKAAAEAAERVARELQQEKALRAIERGLAHV
ncbi:MAG: phage portal protein [Hyphomonadaceae bacterium]|nr:phage portal protein [Hyphomonadaceae bacterium]